MSVFDDALLQMQNVRNKLNDDVGPVCKVEDLV
jgi:hypothetical protein